MCRVVGVLPTATPAYSWTCKKNTCTGSEVVSGNRLSIGVINNNHQGEFTCTVSGSGVTTQSGTFTLQVIGKIIDIIVILCNIMQYSFSRATCGVVHPIILTCHKILQLLRNYHINFKRVENVPNNYI